jgi:hypothetical protein
MTTALEIQENALRNAVADGLAELTAPQRALFHRIYGENVVAKDLVAAHDLVDRTP